MHPGKAIFSYLLALYPRQKLEDGQRRGIGRSMCSTMVAEAQDASVTIKVTTPAWKNSPHNSVTRCALSIRDRKLGAVVVSADIGICHVCCEVQLFSLEEPANNLRWSRDVDNDIDCACSEENVALDRLEGYLEQIVKGVTRRGSTNSLNSGSRHTPAGLTLDEIRQHLRVPQFGAGLKAFNHRLGQAEMDKHLRDLRDA